MERSKYTQHNQPHNITYIIVAFDFFQKNRRLRLAVVTCWVSENLLFFDSVHRDHLQAEVNLCYHHF
jgi:hypothetical protein